MSNYYEDVYLKRLNRYGYDYQTRVQTQRERQFEGKLLKSVYRVEFEFDNEIHPATLERYKQDETRILQYLFTRTSLKIPTGTILMIQDEDFVEQPYMIYWLEKIKASGYNKYVVLKMTHLISWKDREGKSHSSWAYLYGEEDNMLRNELRARSRQDAVYSETMKLSYFILPTSKFIRRDDYLEVGEGNLKESYLVTGYDIHSTPGVEYVIINPTYLRDHTPAPVQNESSNPDVFYWLNGGEGNG